MDSNEVIDVSGGEDIKDKIVQTNVDALNENEIINSIEHIDCKNDDHEENSPIGNEWDDGFDETMDFCNAEICEKIINNETRYKFGIIYSRKTHNNIQLFCKTGSDDIPVPGPLDECMGAGDGDEVIMQMRKQRIHVPLDGKVVHAFPKFENTSRHKLMCILKCDDKNPRLLTPVHASGGDVFDMTSCNNIPEHFTVYQLRRNGRLVFDYYEPIVLDSPYLFEVTFLTEASVDRTGLKYVITKKIEKSEVNLNILIESQSIISDYPESALNEISDVLEDGSRSDYSDLIDLCNVESFTILDESVDGTSSLTFSYHPASEGCHVLSVHIPDVVEYVPMGSSLDTEAEERGVYVFVPSADSLHVLPPKIEDELCSLTPGKIRRVWSINITVDDHGFDVSHDLKHSLVQVDRNISSSEVQRIINENNSTFGINNLTIEEKMTMETKIIKLFQFAEAHAKNRFKNMVASQHYCSFENKSPAQLIMDELSIYLNTCVAKLLLHSYPDCTPLLYQAIPDTNEAKSVNSNHPIDVLFHKSGITIDDKDNYNEDDEMYDSEDEIDFLYDQMPELEDDEIDLLSIEKYEDLNGEQKDVIEDVDNEAQFYAEKESKHISVFSGRIKELKEASSGNVDKNKLCQLIGNVDIYPELLIDYEDVKNGLEQERYVCSDEHLKGHYSLNVDTYCSFTEPLHCYMDLVVQRMVKAMMSDDEAPYSVEEMDEICLQCTTKKRNAQSFQANLYHLHLIEALETKPLRLNLLIKEITEVGLKLCVVNVPKGIFRYEQISELNFNKMAATEIPAVENGRVTVAWQERIYDLCYDSELRASMKKGQMSLDTITNVKQIKNYTTFELMKAVASGKNDKIQKCIDLMYHEVVAPMPDVVKDVTSEVPDHNIAPRICDFNATFHIGDTVQIQIAKDASKIDSEGLMFQLLSLTPTLDICLEHQTKQAACFVAPPTECVNIDSYPNVDVYKRTWKAIVEYEAAESAARVKEGSFIHNVHITWERNDDIVNGSFEINRDFYESQGRSIPRNGYICVRYRDIDTENSPKWPKSVVELYGDQSTITWTGHCTDIDVLISAGKKKKVPTATLR